MENSAKALEIAGSILIAVLIISIVILAYNNMKEVPMEQEEALSTEQLAKYNMQFESYNTTSLKGTDIISVINKAIDSNKKYNATDATDPYYIEIEINLNQTEYKDSLVTTVTQYYLNKDKNWAVGKRKDISEESLKSEKYTLKDNLLEKLMKLSYSDETVYCSDINGTETDGKRYYDNRYKNSIISYSEVVNPISTGKGQYFTKNNIFIEFKRKSFTCTNTEYKNGRISKMIFSEV